MEALLLILVLFNFIAIMTVAVFLYLNNTDIIELQENVKTIENTTIPAVTTRVTAVEEVENNSKEHIKAKMAQINTEVSDLKASLIVSLDAITATSINNDTTKKTNVSHITSALTSANLETGTYYGVNQYDHTANPATGSAITTDNSQPNAVLSINDITLPNKDYIKTLSKINNMYIRFLSLVDEAKVLYKVAQTNSFAADVQVSYDAIIAAENVVSAKYNTKITGE